MILILSQKEYEISTELVMEWISKLGGTYVRYNVEDFRTQNFSYNFPHIVEEDKEKNDIFKEINCVWYRRWEDYSPSINGLCDDEATYYNLKDFLYRECLSASGIFFDSLRDKFWLSHPFNSDPNKLKQLKLAQLHGMHIPFTIVTNNKQQLLSFKQKMGDIITKPIVNGTRLAFSNIMYVTYTSEVDNDYINNLPETFAHSLFQEKINKQLEIRSFYLNGRFDSMAIFSQSNEKTEVDFRLYDDKKPNRTVPYQLPKELELNLKNLMSDLNLNTGSIDLILDVNSNYYFLEVNPIGQFGMVSKPCNYNLEKKIAELLIENDIKK